MHHYTWAKIKFWSFNFLIAWLGVFFVIAQITGGQISKENIFITFVAVLALIYRIKNKYQIMGHVPGTMDQITYLIWAAPKLLLVIAMVGIFLATLIPMLRSLF